MYKFLTNMSFDGMKAVKTIIGRVSGSNIDNYLKQF